MSQQRGKIRRTVAALLMLMICLQPAAEAQRQTAGSEPMPLVALNQQYAEWLAQADKLLADGETAEAVRAYQGLIVKGEGGAGGDDQRIIPLSRIATARIGTLDGEALELYRALYGPAARRLLDRARRDLDRNALRRVVAEYFHTSYGDQALVLLGGLQFDRGRFAQAARTFQRALDRRSPMSVRRDVTLARAAVAWHLADVPTSRDKRLAELAAEYPQATAVLAGVEQNILAFVRSQCGQAATATAPSREGGGS